MLNKNSGRQLLLSLSLLLGFTQLSYSQAYTTVIGGRISDDYGITLKQRIGNSTSIEGLYYGGFTNNPIFTSVLLEQHMPLISKRLNIFVGAGIGLRWFNDEVIFREFQNEPVIPFVIGADLTVGRLNITADVMPHYILTRDGDNTLTNNAAISVRYVVIKRKKPQKKKFGEKLGNVFTKSDKEKKKKAKAKAKAKSKNKTKENDKTKDKNKTKSKDRKIFKTKES